MFERLLKGLLVGIIAAAGAYSLGADTRAIGLIALVPVIFAFFDLMVASVFSLFLLFGVGALLWSYTPLGEVAVDAFNKISRSSAQRTSQ